MAHERTPDATNDLVLRDGPAPGAAPCLETLKQQLRIAVIYSGDKRRPGSVIYPTPTARPWKSYEAVANDIKTALEQIGFRQVITLPDDMRLPHRLKRYGVHLAWLNSGGVQGHHPAAHTPAMLELLGVPFVGHGSLHAALLDNKAVFKRQIQALGVATAPFAVWHPAAAAHPCEAPEFTRVFAGHAGPFVVKPVSGRASLLVHLARTPAELSDAAMAVYEQTHNSVLIESYLPGREFCISVARRGRDAWAFAPVERVLAPDEAIFTSMDERPITTGRVRPVPFEEADLRAALREMGRQVFGRLDLRSLVRFDIRADAHGTLHVLEGNPKPDLKRPSGAVTNPTLAGLAEEGMTYNDLIGALLTERLHYLFTYEREAVAHLREMVCATRAVIAA
jgi:D-alanine-D-alanine ligase